MYSDPIADMLNRLKTASLARKEEITIPSSRLKEEILKTLQKRGFIETVERVKSGSYEELIITFKKNIPPLNVKKISKPGQRIYVKSCNLKKVKSGLGTAVISTSRGIMSLDEAKKNNLGGEFLCEIY